jgi:pyridoxal 5'-phosphate synthase pdxT subunit
MVTIGVLGLQGAVREHILSLEACGAKAVIIKKVEQLEDIDGLILPGGESTTMRKLIDQFGFMEPIRNFAKVGKPLFGTCAGLILLAKELVDHPEPHLGLFDVTVERNSFGRQIDSFEEELYINGLEEPFIGVFIRAPHIVRAGENVEILAKHDGRIVAAREGHILGCSFHPELTDDHRFTSLFVDMVHHSVEN